MNEGWNVFISLVCVVGVTCTAPLLLMMVWRRLLHFRHQKDNQDITTEAQQRLEKEMDDSDDMELFLRRRISFLTEKEMLNLECGDFLGRGAYGCVRRVVYQGTQAVLKEFHDPSRLHVLLREARLSLLLDGAGGVPRVLAVCRDPAAMVQEFVGKTYDQFLVKCCVIGLLDSLVAICCRLEEMHAKGVIHNDLKVHNLTYTGSVTEPVLHIIDLGLACRAGRVADDFRAKSATEEEEQEYCDNEDIASPWPWVAPEMLAGRRVRASGDVYSLGFLLQYLTEGCRQHVLAQGLWRTGQLCLQRDPRRRPSLRQVILAIKDLRDKLLPHELDEKFDFHE